jgi:hypothetical protein
MALVGGGLRATSLHRELAKRRTTRRRGNQQASFDLQIARSSERWATDQAHHEPRWRAAVERPAPDVSRIIPGDWGKAGPGWLALPLLSAERKFGAGGRIHQFLWRCSRIVSEREKGTVR